MISKVLDKRLTGIISYITIVGWLIAYLLGDVEGAKFHLNQAFVLGIAEIILSAVAGVLSIIPVIGMIISLIVWLLDVIFVIFAIIGIISAVKEQEKPLPVIGGIKILK